MADTHEPYIAGQLTFGDLLPDDMHGEDAARCGSCLTTHRWRDLTVSPYSVGTFIECRKCRRARLRENRSYGE
jgi:hypothetical protein